MMKRQNLVASLCCSLCLAVAPALVQANCHQRTGGNQVVGTLLGAALGGLIGSQIGSGSGNKVAIGAGVLAGGLIGNKVGDSLDCRDREYHNSTAQSSFETQRTGTTSSWVNPDSGHGGSVTPVQTYQRNDGVYCRDFEQTITVDGETELAGGTACRQPDGTWQIVSS